MVVRSYALFGTGDPLHISDDQGSTWTTVPATGLAPVATVRDISVDPYYAYNSLICTAYQGIYKSTDGGSTYALIPATNGINWIKILHRDSLRVIAVGSQISHSYDGGNSFVNSGLNPVTMYGAYTAPVASIYAYDVYFENYNDGYMSIYDKLFRTTDGGLTWTVLNGDLPIVADDPITGISSNNTKINIVTGDGIYYSSDSGASFSLSQSLGGTSIDRNAMYTYDSNYIYVIDVSGDIWRSGDTGLTWTNTGNLGVGAVTYKSIYAFSSNSILIMFPGVSFNSEVFKSIDGGTTSTSELAPSARGWALDSSIPTDCGTCPTKTTYNPITGYCELNEPGLPLCAVGYYYEPSNNTCVLIEDINDSYPAPPCPSECPVIPGGDGRGLCDCTFQYNIPLCCYELTDCNNIADSIITDTDLSDYFDESNIIKIQGSDVCWEITKLPDALCPDAVSVIVTTVFNDCLACNPSYALYNCTDVELVLYTTQDFSAYVTPSKTVQLVEYPNSCWQVGINTNPDFAPEVLTVSGDPYDSCDTCIPIYYTLTNCEIEQVIYAEPTAELLANDGLVINIEEQTGCWTVEKFQEFTEEILISVTVTQGGYADCTCCLPTPAPEPTVFTRTTQKPVKKFYHIADSECDIRVNTKFANNYYKLFNTIKNGMGNCCEGVDLDKLWIEKELSDYSLINPPGECVTPPAAVVVPDCPAATVVACSPPTDVSGTGDFT